MKMRQYLTGLVCFTALHVQSRQLLPAMGAERLPGSVLAKSLSSLLNTPLTAQRKTQPIPGKVKSFVQAKRLPEGVLGLDSIPGSLQQIAQVVPGTCAWLEQYSAALQSHSLGMLTAASCQKCKRTQSLRIIRLELQQLLETALRLLLGTQHQRQACAQPPPSCEKTHHEVSSNSNSRTFSTSSLVENGFVM